MEENRDKKPKDDFFLLTSVSGTFKWPRTVERESGPSGRGRNRRGVGWGVGATGERIRAPDGPTL